MEAFDGDENVLYSWTGKAKRNRYSKTRSLTSSHAQDDLQVDSGTTLLFLEPSCTNDLGRRYRTSLIGFLFGFARCVLLDTQVVRRQRTGVNRHSGLRESYPRAGAQTLAAHALILLAPMWGFAARSALVRHSQLQRRATDREMPMKWINTFLPRTNRSP